MKNKNKKVLIIEDDPYIADMYATKFRMNEYEIKLAKNGVKAFDELQKEKPDIILLDLLMPGMDGYEFLEKIKKEKEFKNIKVIILTNLGQKREIERALKLGANDYIVKAYFTPEEVVRKVEKLLNCS